MQETKPENKTQNQTPQPETKEKAVGKCPGCGTQLEMRGFTNVFTMDREPAETTEDLYCPNCHIRWIQEAHSGILDIVLDSRIPKVETKKIVILNIPLEEYALLQQIAKTKGKDANQTLIEIIKERTNEETGNTEFEENGILYEQLMIDLPKTVVNFYRYMAHTKGKDGLMETFVSFDLIDHLNAQIQGITPENLKELFNLNPALIDMANRENKILSEKD